MIECLLFFVLYFLLFIKLELNFVLFNVINKDWLGALKFDDLFFVVKLCLVCNFYVACDLLDFNFIDVNFLFSFSQLELTFAFIRLYCFLLFLHWFHRTRFGFDTELLNFILVLRKLFIQTLNSFFNSTDFLWIISWFGIYGQCW